MAHIYGTHFIKRDTKWQMCRWRSQKEVVSGKGHFSCGSKGCDAKDGLVSYEVNFAYQEAGREKQVGWPVGWPAGVEQPQMVCVFFQLENMTI